MKKACIYLLGAGVLLYLGNLVVFKLLATPNRPSSSQLSRAQLRQQLDELVALAEFQEAKQQEISNKLIALQEDAAKEAQEFQEVAHKPPPQFVLPVLLIACNRPTVEKPLRELIQYRPSAEKFPIIVSQDCGGHEATANVIKSFKKDIIKHIIQPDNTKFELPQKEKKYEGYYKLSRHYKWALTHMFDELNYDTVIILEDVIFNNNPLLLNIPSVKIKTQPLDDLEISPDFFSYFEATFHLLESDDSLYCVSAWNDNGKDAIIANDPKLLWRTDFFPGLGWMLRRKVWDELKDHWPAGFWDDWLRQEGQRKGRACIRPEKSRTSTFGKVGVSKGTYFDKHLKFIHQNMDPVDFQPKNLKYLHKDEYDANFVKKVYSSKLVQLKDLATEAQKKEVDSVRLQYSSKASFKQLAKVLNIMDDFKDGVPRMAYRGVVPIMHQGLRVYISPPADWKKYDPTWT